MKKIIFAFVMVTLVAFFQLALGVPVNINSFVFWLELYVLGMVTFGFWIPFFREYPEFLIGIGVAIPFLLVIVFCLLYHPLFSLKDYQKSATIVEPIEVEFNTEQIQLIDKDSAQKLGDRVFGTIGEELVSQFYVGNYTQCVYQGKLVRVAPIEFGGLFSYLNNKKTPGYIVVDVKTGEAEVVKTPTAVAQSGKFMHQISRMLFFHNMTYQYGKIAFEIDEEGAPYYVAPVYRTNFEALKDIKAIVLINAINGETTEYPVDEVPEWVDNVYPVEISYSKFNRAKKYVNGNFNFSKKGVVQLTEDYSYLQVNGRLFFYSGVTSVSNDESNVGYVYVDCHTGVFHYTESFGAEEFSARASAEGVLQEKGYTSVFPTLVNLNGEEVYFMALKDNAGLIKAYALVSYKDYQKAVVGETPEEAAKKFNSRKTVDEEEIVENTVELTISAINQIVIEGNTIVIIEDDQGIIHSYNIAKGDLKMALLKEGETIKVTENGNHEIKARQ